MTKQDRTGRDRTGQGRTGQGRTWQGRKQSNVNKRCPHLGHFGVQALAHLHSSVRHQDSAICVDMYQGSSLVQELGGEGDAKLGGDNSQTPFAPPVGPVELITCLLPLSKTCLINDTIPTGLQPPPNCCILTRAWAKGCVTQSKTIGDRSLESKSQPRRRLNLVNWDKYQLLLHTERAMAQRWWHLWLQQHFCLRRTCILLDSILYLLTACCF